MTTKRSNAGTPPTAPTTATKSRARTGAAGAVPTSAASIDSPEAKQFLMETALKLRDEQIRAKVVYFGVEQETNEELDAITEAVVAELYALQAAGAQAAEPHKPADVQRELVKNLRAFLDKLFSTRRKTFLKRKTEEIQRRITNLFFNSELFSKIAAVSPEALDVAWPDQAVYYALKRHEAAIVADLHLLKYSRKSVRDDAVARLQRFEKELRMEFLSRTTPELEKLLAIFRDVLTKFYRQFRKDLQPFCTTVIEQARLGSDVALGYKIGVEGFRPFREAFDRHFLDSLVLNVQGPLVEQAQGMADTFRADTLRFMADPHIFSEICAVMCDACYDYLYGEGFLELPADWRAAFDRQ